MKKQLVKSILAAAIVLAAPAVSSAAIYTYATGVEDYTGVGLVDDARDDIENAIGENYGDFLSLGLRGSAIFTFGVEFTDAATVTEITYGSREDYEETADVYVSTDKINWTFVQSITNLTDTSEFSFTGSWSYLKIVDTTPDTSPSSPSSDGFDVDVVGVVPVPEPGTMMLFGAGIASLAAISRRRK